LDPISSPASASPSIQPKAGPEGLVKASASSSAMASGGVPAGSADFTLATSRQYWAYGHDDVTSSAADALPPDAKHHRAPMKRRRAQGSLTSGRDGGLTHPRSP